MLYAQSDSSNPLLSRQTGGVKEDRKLTIPVSVQWDDLTFGEAFCLQGLAAPAIAGEPAYLDFPRRGSEVEAGPVSEPAQLDMGVGIPRKGRLGCLRQEVFECCQQSYGCTVRRTGRADKYWELRKCQARGGTGSCALATKWVLRPLIRAALSPWQVSPEPKNLSGLWGR